MAEVFIRSRTTFSIEQAPQQLVARDLEVAGNIAENPRQCADLQRIVRRNRYMMLGRGLRGEPDMATRLAGDSVSDSRERLGKRGARKVAWDLQAAITSSRTKCRRISLG